MSNEHAQVLIVGAGPVGLSAAIELGRLGAHCVVVERNDRVGYSPRAKTTNGFEIDRYCDTFANRMIVRCPDEDPAFRRYDQAVEFLRICRVIGAGHSAEYVGTVIMSAQNSGWVEVESLFGAMARNRPRKCYL
jgi:predicted flavoprotein YhiN